MRTVRRRTHRLPQQRVDEPPDAANDLHASAAFRQNAIRAGLPPNFFVMNPAIGNANITRSLAGTCYNGVQFERRRFSQGLLLNANYTWARSYGSSLQTLRSDRIYLQNTDVPHSFKMQWVYEVPVGRGRRFGSDMNRWLNAVVGNWEYSGTGRLHKELYDMGSVRVVGMSMSELQDAFQIRTFRDDQGAITVFSFPQDIIDNTRRAYNTDPTSPTGYSGDGAPTGRYIAPEGTPDCIAVYRGDCGAPRQVLLLGPDRDAVRHAPQQAVPVRPEGQPRTDTRDVERVRQHQLQPPGGAGRRCGHLPGDDGLHRHQHDGGSSRTHRPDPVAPDLVARIR